MSKVYPYESSVKPFSRPSTIPGDIKSKKIVPFTVWHILRMVGKSVEEGSADFFRGEWYTSKLEFVITPAEFRALREYFESITYDMEEYYRNIVKVPE